ncbi:MAG: response regulator [Vicinamibacterales bacterium]
MVFAYSAVRRNIMIVDDDSSTCESLGSSLLQQGFVVAYAGTASEAENLAHQQTFDFLVLEPQLPDASGFDGVRRIVEAANHAAFVLVSRNLSVSLAVEAMKLGANDVREKPYSPEEIVSLARNAVCRHGVSEYPSSRIDPAIAGTGSAARRSAAERWAWHVIRAIRADDDLKTLEDWSRHVGVSYSSLGEACRLMGIRPQDARDLARALRALLKSRLEGCAPEVLLDVSDRRTLKAFVARAGPEFLSEHHAVSVETFLETQNFVQPHNEGVRALVARLRAEASDPRSVASAAQSISAAVGANHAKRS